MALLANSSAQVKHIKPHLFDTGTGVWGGYIAKCDKRDIHTERTFTFPVLVSSVRSSSGYHGLIEIRSAAAATHFFKFFKFFRFESESESERTQHVLYF